MNIALAVLSEDEEGGIIQVKGRIASDTMIRGLQIPGFGFQGFRFHQDNPKSAIAKFWVSHN